MKIILSEMTASLVGTLERGLGYHIEHRKNGFFSKRNQKSFCPPDGHWRFIVLCAELAKNKLYIADIEVSGIELREALTEAGLSSLCSRVVRREVLSAADIINLKKNLGL